MIGWIRSGYGRARSGSVGLGRARSGTVGHGRASSGIVGHGRARSGSRVGGGLNFSKYVQDSSALVGC